jgi:uncharacterized protein (DUF885 family)
LGLVACGPAPAPATPPNGADLGVPHDSLSRIVDRYWDEHASLANPLSPQFMADSLAVERRFLAVVLALPRERLDTNSRLTYDIFRRQRELNIEGFTYPEELLPVNPFAGMPQQLARLAAESREHPLESAKDYENWLLRIDDYVGWTQQAIANMREGMRRGYTSPRVLMQQMLPLLQGLGEDTSANVFFGLLRSLPDTLKEPDRTRLTDNLNRAIRDKLLPAYRQLHDFIQNDYLPRARTTVALAALPLGSSWYAYRVKRATDSPLTPKEIHVLGVAELERIRARLQIFPAGAPAVGANAGASAGAGANAAANAGTGANASAGAGAGANAGTSANANANASAGAGANANANAGTSANASAGAGGVSNPYLEWKVLTLAAIPTLFSDIPQADLDSAPAGAAPAGATIAHYLRDEIPGRHYQILLQQARADLPKFRRFGGDAGFVEGWALYAESLGEELGLYRDDEAKRNALFDQLKCTVALVADTGLHAEGWTRAQAVDYLRAQLAAGDANVDLMADRFVAMPGDALACMMGDLKIRALRGRAQQVMGGRFDIREFHSAILKDGAMPLDILEAKMNLWMGAGR